MKPSNFPERFRILVKPDCSENKLVGFDESRNAWRVEIAAPAEDNKANIEVIKFFSKLTKKRVRIVSGLTSKEKLLSITK